MGDFVIQVFGWKYLENIWKYTNISSEYFDIELSVGVRSLYAAGRYFLGLLLVKQGGHFRPDFSRYHHRPHHDLHGTGGQERSSKSDLSDCSGLFCIHLIYVHFLHCSPGKPDSSPPTSHLICKFGLVHHFTKMGSGEYYLEELENEICRKNDLDKSEKKRYRKSSSYSLTKTVRY